jgi:hypothetical protein
MEFFFNRFVDCGTQPVPTSQKLYHVSVINSQFVLFRDVMAVFILRIL